MIKISVPEDAKKKHIKYFESGGLKILKSYIKNNTNFTSVELSFLTYLNKRYKELLIGEPKILKQFIEKYSSLDFNSDCKAAKLVQAKKDLNNQVNFKGLSESKRVEYLTLWKNVYSDKNEIVEVIDKFFNERDCAIEYILKKISSEDKKSIQNSINAVKNKTKSINDFICDVQKAKLRSLSKDDLKDNKKYVIDVNCLQRDLKNNIPKPVSEFKMALFEVFNYNKFVKGDNCWGAYEFVKSIGVNVCPYCNRSYISIVDSISGKTRPELDHYYPKNKYPFLGLSLFNLVPSCHVCNSNLKNDKDFYEERHIHPYSENLHDYAIFKSDLETDVSSNDLDRLLSGLYILKPKSEIDQETCIQVENTINTFKLNELYKNHHDVSSEILFKSQMYSPERIQDLDDIMSELLGGVDLELDNIGIHRLILGNYIHPSDFNKRPLAKFTYDVAKDVRLIKD